MRQVRALYRMRGTWVSWGKKERKKIHPPTKANHRKNSLSSSTYSGHTRVYAGTKRFKVEALYFLMIAICRPRIPCVNFFKKRLHNSDVRVTSFRHIRLPVADRMKSKQSRGNKMKDALVHSNRGARRLAARTTSCCFRLLSVGNSTPSYVGGTADCGSGGFPLLFHSSGDTE